MPGSGTWPRNGARRGSAVVLRTDEAFLKSFWAGNPNLEFHETTALDEPASENRSDS